LEKNHDVFEKIKKNQIFNNLNQIFLNQCRERDKALECAVP